MTTLAEPPIPAADNPTPEQRRDRARAFAAMLGKVIDPYSPEVNAENFDLDLYLSQFDPVLMASAEGRKALCRLDPMLFALTYMRKHLKNKDGVISFSDAHFLWVRAARRWIGPSRGQREDRKAFVAPRSCGKPLAIDGLVLMGDGSRKRLGDIEVGDWVITDKGRARRVTEVHIQGKLPAVRITTRRGRVAEAALDHPFLTERGWVDAAQLKVDDRIVTVPRPDVVTGASRRPEEFALAGYFIGDGHATTAVAFRGGETARSNGLNSAITCADPVELDHLRELAEVLGFAMSGPHGLYTYYLGGGARQWLRDTGIAASSSYTKRVPGWVFAAPAQRIAAFLAAYFACDGTVSANGNVSEYYSVSRDLLGDVQHLLQRLGIRSTLQPKRGRINGQVHHSWRLRVENATAFAAAILPHLRSVKAERLAQATAVGRFGDGDHVVSVEPIEPVECRCLTVDEDHTFTYQDLVVHNSTWWFLILPMWGGAFGHARFVAAFADSGSMAELHLATFKAEHADNAMLRADFPDLCNPARRHTGRTVADNQNMLHSRSGFTFVAKGIDSTSLGMKMGADRPDVLIFDDCEPPEATYSPFQREKRLSTIENAILPLNELARVVLVGTVTMPGSIVHELVRHSKGEDVEPWVDEQKIKTYHSRAIVTRQDGTRRSIWPQKWTLEYLQSIEHTRSYKLNYDNDPKGREGRYWAAEDFTYGTPAGITKWFMFLDPPTTMKTTSDDCGIAIVGYSPAIPRASKVTQEELTTWGREELTDGVDKAGRPRFGRLTRREALEALEKGTGARLSRVHVEFAQGVKLTGKRLRTHVLGLLQRFPGVERLVVENNQGGDLWVEVFDDFPIRVTTYPTREKKEVKFARALDLQQRHRVTFKEVIPDLEDQMLAWPLVPHDDIVDAVSSAVVRLLTPKLARRDKTVNPG